ncbi:hypothetical protein CRENBAI_017425 [Crenichthys baileyi]|uniref:Uncharacterized protein n=1 Tax=Crenichthys baileyi TaxID=28760 RepID=A0AAV9RD06_9TELE
MTYSEKQQVRFSLMMTSGAVPLIYALGHPIQLPSIQTDATKVQDVLLWERRTTTALQTTDRTTSGVSAAAPPARAQDALETSTAEGVLTRKDLRRGVQAHSITIEWLTQDKHASENG